MGRNGGEQRGLRTRVYCDCGAPNWWKVPLNAITVRRCAKCGARLRTTDGITWDIMTWSQRGVYLLAYMYFFPDTFDVFDF